ncbi:MAG TPA: hypothetical protein PLZ51_18140, partial [Aggregatilineales bacterium]|nr:hypothetical protein [Aggregatilineales bacterium]
IYVLRTGSGNAQVSIDGAGATMQNFFRYALFATAAIGSTGTLDITAQNITMPNNNTALSGDGGLYVEGMGNGIVTADILNNALTNYSNVGNAGISIVLQANTLGGNDGAGGRVSNITGNTLSDTGGGRPSLGILVRLAGGASLDVNITNNNVSGATVSALNLFTTAPWTSVMNVVMANNNFDVEAGTLASTNVLLDGSGVVNISDNGSTHDGTGQSIGGLRYRNLVASSITVNFTATNNTYIPGLSDAANII